MAVDTQCTQKRPITIAAIDDPHKEATSGYVERVLNGLHEDSQLHFKDVPEVLKSELTIGEKLGTGGFATVRAVKLNGKSYAMKHLQDSVIEGDRENFFTAASDLIKEAGFLSALDHPNIIGIHGKCTSTWTNDFIIIDRLKETLTDRIKRWRKQEAKAMNTKQRMRCLYERLEVCQQICDAIYYLHENNIIYRDLKASNVGFDEEGKVKLFDFGLARELKDELKVGDKYRLSGKTGSRAYMAPEVAKGWKYDKTVDVYSFGILMWEIVSLQPAFSKYRTDELMNRHVWTGDERPPLRDWWPVELRWLMKNCWAYFSKSRPNFSIIKEALEELLDEEEDEDSSAQSIRTFRFGSRTSHKRSEESAGSFNKMFRWSLLHPSNLFAKQ